MCSSRVASSQGPTGPGRRLGTTGACRWRYTVARETFQQRATRGSWPRPPACQRGAGLEAGNLLPQQLGLHGHLADLSLQPRDLVVAVVALALLQRRLGGQQSPLLPFRQPRRRNGELPCHQLQWFAPQQPAHRPQLPLRREALPRWPAGGLVSASFLGALRQARRLRRALLRHSVHSALLPLVRLTAAE